VRRQPANPHKSSPEQAERARQQADGPSCKIEVKGASLLPHAGLDAC
jgi:hypothetical protein